MPQADKRNVLHNGTPSPGETEITPAMVESARKRINDAGGTLTVWAVLYEDVYESRYGDGFYLHLHGLALNGEDAQRLAALPEQTELVSWHVRRYALGLVDGQPSLLGDWEPEEEFTINQIVAVLCEIPLGGTASKLLTGTGLRKDGPLLSLS